MNENNENKTLLLSVHFDNNKNNYCVSLGKGSNVPETAFAMAVIIKCLLKDKYIEKSEEVTSLIDKYLSDPQYEEIKETE